MKSFYGNVSLTARVGFALDAEDKQKATDIVFEDIEGLMIVLKNGSAIEITEVNWDLIEKERRGNVKESVYWRF